VRPKYELLKVSSLYLSLRFLLCILFTAPSFCFLSSCSYVVVQVICSVLNFSPLIFFLPTVVMSSCPPMSSCPCLRSFSSVLSFVTITGFNHSIFIIILFYIFLSSSFSDTFASCGAPIKMTVHLSLSLPPPLSLSLCLHVRPHLTSEQLNRFE